MKIHVRFSDLDSRIKNAIVSHIGEKWSTGEVIVEEEGPPTGELEGLLAVTDGHTPATADALVTEFVEIPDGQADVPLDDLLFQVDAKLGRLTRSYLARQSTQSSLAAGATLTRRDLLLGARNSFRRYSDAPVFFEDSCEEKYGCSRCIEACPVDALTLTGHAISVNENDCTRCGLCVAACPVGAAQMPKFSDAAFLGLLDAIDHAQAPKKTLVLTCDRRGVSRESWIDVEEIASVGVIGPRQLAMAAASSLGAIVVSCPDGGCEGRDSARRSVEALSQALGVGTSAPSISYVEGSHSSATIAQIHRSSRTRVPVATRTGDRWKDYVAELRSLSTEESPSSGLAFTKLTIADTCTLCKACVESCPHSALRADSSRLLFDAAACTGCGSCARVCPEHSVSLARADGRLSELMREAGVYEDEVALCARCKAPIGSVKFVRKVSSLLGTDSALVSYCPSCKQRLAFESLTGGTKHGQSR